MGLDLGRVRDNRSPEERAVLLGFGGVLRKEAPFVLLRHQGVTSRLPHVRWAKRKEGLRHMRTPTGTALRGFGSLGEGERRVARVHEVGMLEVALERPAVRRSFLGRPLYAAPAPTATWAFWAHNIFQWGRREVPNYG